MDTRISGFSNPDMGLASIDRFESPAVNLPAQRESQLTGDRIKHWVGDIFKAENFDQTLRDFVSVKVSDPSLLSPTRLTSKLRDCGEKMQEMASHLADAKLADAAAVLKNNDALNKLLSDHLSLLHRG